MYHTDEKQCLINCKNELIVHRKTNFPWNKLVSYLLINDKLSNDFIRFIMNNTSAINVRKVLKDILLSKKVPVNINKAILQCRNIFNATDIDIRTMIRNTNGIGLLSISDDIFTNLDISSDPAGWLKWSIERFNKPYLIIDKFDPHMSSIINTNIKLDTNDEILNLWISYHRNEKREISILLVYDIVKLHDLKFFNMIVCVTTDINDMYDKIWNKIFYSMSCKYETLLFIINNDLLPINESILINCALCKIWNNDGSFEENDESIERSLNLVQFLVNKTIGTPREFNKDLVEDIKAIIPWKKYVHFYALRRITLKKAIEYISIIAGTRNPSPEIIELKNTLYRRPNLVRMLNEEEESYREPLLMDLCVIC